MNFSSTIFMSANCKSSSSGKWFDWSRWRGFLRKAFCEKLLRVKLILPLRWMAKGNRFVSWIVESTFACDKIKGWQLCWKEKHHRRDDSLVGKKLLKFYVWIVLVSLKNANFLLRIVLKFFFNFLTYVDFENVENLKKSLAMIFVMKFSDVKNFCQLFVSETFKNSIKTASLENFEIKFNF